MNQGWLLVKIGIWPCVRYWNIFMMAKCGIDWWSKSWTSLFKEILKISKCEGKQWCWKKEGADGRNVIREENLWDLVNEKLRKLRKITPRCFGYLWVLRKRNKFVRRWVECQNVECGCNEACESLLEKWLWPLYHWADLRPWVHFSPTCFLSGWRWAGSVRGLEERREKIRGRMGNPNIHKDCYIQL